MFAVQYRGECYGSADGLNTFNRYGPSKACTADGEGGAWANEVYKITGQTVVKPSSHESTNQPECRRNENSFLFVVS